MFPGVGGQPAENRRGCHLPPAATQTLSLPVSVSMYTELSLSVPRLFIWCLRVSFFCPFLFLILIPGPYLPSSLDFLPDLSVSHLSVLQVSPSFLVSPSICSPSLKACPSFPCLFFSFLFLTYLISFLPLISCLLSVSFLFSFFPLTLSVSVFWSLRLCLALPYCSKC